MNVENARRLRRAMSLPEVLLWRQLRTRPGGYKFRRQFPQSPYTLDFACLSCRVAIEVDGEVHGFGDHPRMDAIRDRIIENRGFRTLRLPAREVLQDMERCVRGIVAACEERVTCRGEVGRIHHPADITFRVGEE